MNPSEGMSVDLSEDGIPNVLGHLYSRELLARPRITRLSGGVSAETLLVETEPARLVVKRALARLRVAGDWRAKPERAATEAAALQLLHGLTPQHTPRLCDLDSQRNVIVMTAAPADWVPWKSVLLGDLPDPTPGFAPTAACLGTVLGTWHKRTWHDQAVADRFADYEAFGQLRIAPFHRAVAAAHPEVAAAVQESAEELLSRRDCLVHGDYSPKNVLVGPEGLMVLDFEVAHFGAAVFDLAFLLCHLVLKAVHLPQRAAQLVQAASAFLSAYERTCPGSFRATTERLSRHIACLLLARVDGLSPAGYLAPDSVAAVRGLALDLLREDEPSVAELWNRIQGAS